MKEFKNNILVPTDFSEKSIIALEQSFTLAKALNLEVILLNIRQDTKTTFFFSIFSDEEKLKLKKEYEDNCRNKLQEISEKASKKYKIKVNTMLAKGKVYEKILEIADQINAKYIVMAANGNPVKDKSRSLGSNISKVIVRSKCPVIVSNANLHKNFSKIVLPLDLTKETRQKVTKAIEFARQHEVEIKVISVLWSDDKEISTHLNIQLFQVTNFIKSANIKCTGKLLKCPRGKYFAETILKYTNEKDADIIMIMTQQEVSSSKFFLGSTAQQVILNADTPVMVINPKEMNMIGGFNY